MIQFSTVDKVLDVVNSIIQLNQPPPPFGDAIIDAAFHAIRKRIADRDAVKRLRAALVEYIISKMGDETSNSIVAINVPVAIGDIKRITFSSTGDRREFDYIRRSWSGLKVLLEAYIDEKAEGQQYRRLGEVPRTDYQEVFDRLRKYNLVSSNTHRVLSELYATFNKCRRKPKDVSPSTRLDFEKTASRATAALSI